MPETKDPVENTEAVEQTEVVEEMKESGKPTYQAERVTTQAAQKKVEESRRKAPDIDPLAPPTRYKK